MFCQLMYLVSETFITYRFSQIYIPKPNNAFRHEDRRFCLCCPGKGRQVFLFCFWKGGYRSERIRLQNLWRPSALSECGPSGKGTGSRILQRLRLMHEKGFPTPKIGNRMITPKERFIQWMEVWFEHDARVKVRPSSHATYRVISTTTSSPPLGGSLWGSLPHWTCKASTRSCWMWARWNG